MILASSEVDIQKLIAEYQATRKYTEDICIPLNIEDYIPQPVDFVSPPKWHLAHTTWFFEEFVLKKYKPNYQTFHEDFSFLFNSYYNGVGERINRSSRGCITRPDVAEVYKYRQYVNEQLIEFLSTAIISKEIESTIILGLNHEQQHQELLITDLKYTLSQNPIHPVYQSDFSLVHQFNAAEDQGYEKIEEGIYEIGYAGDDFHWDNELGRHKVYLHEAEIAKGLVTNQDFIDFINDDGYKVHDLWLDEGWSWIKENEVEVPQYWLKKQEQWYHYTLSGLKAVDPKAILCHINFFEAAAFAEWKGMRLPTEFEWEVVSDRINWGSRWEWTNSAYLPYPGFRTAEGAIGEYNGKFMVNQKVLRGASTATSPGHSRKTYRNFFHTHLQWQCTGIRLAKL